MTCRSGRTRRPSWRRTAAARADGHPPSADGAVFNVSRGREYSGAGGCYHALAGRDSSRLLAKGRLEPASARSAAEPLRRLELETLREWRELFEFKYVRLGPLRDGEATRRRRTHQESAGRARQAALAARPRRGVRRRIASSKLS